MNLKQFNTGEPELNPIRKYEELVISPLRATQFGLINHRLEDFYKKNGITKNDIDLKNYMRHMGGSALLASDNWLGGRRVSKYWGDYKELFDILRNRDDGGLDLQNNKIGRDIGKQYHDKTTDEILQKVYEEALKRLNSNQ